MLWARYAFKSAATVFNSKASGLFETPGHFESKAGAIYQTAEKYYPSGLSAG